MQLEFHDGRISYDVSDATIEAAFKSLSEPSDFVILRNHVLGEVRAAGPLRGHFVLQCDLRPSPRMFNGQLELVSIDKAIDIFQCFRKGDLSWRSNFVDLNGALPLRTKLVLGLAAIVFIALLLSVYLLPPGSH